MKHEKENVLRDAWCVRCKEVVSSQHSVVSREN